jgi:hypothetical protein
MRRSLTYRAVEGGRKIKPFTGRWLTVRLVSKPQIVGEASAFSNYVGIHYLKCTPFRAREIGRDSLNGR